MENWKAIAGFPGYYVSDMGRVRSWKKHRGRAGPRLLNFGKLKRGHLTANLYRHGRGLCMTVHRLVLNAFVGPRPAGLQCRHLNGNPADNKLKNLRWGTSRENAADRTKHGRHYKPRGSEVGTSKLKTSDVLRIKRLLYVRVLLQREIGVLLGVSPSCISSINTGDRWNHVKI